MAKIGVFGFTEKSFSEQYDLKKYFLMFDQLVLCVPDSFFFTKDKTAIFSGNTDELSIPDNNFTLRNLQYLIAQGFVEVFFFTDVPRLSAGNITADEQALLADEAVREIATYSLQSKSDDMVPLLLNHPPVSVGQKKEILNFLLSEIPEPDNTVSWEQLQEFKSDPNTMRKYYGLIKWVNDFAKKEVPIQELRDEFNYLYHEYDHHFDLHKMKKKRGFIELLVTGTFDYLAGTLAAGGVMSNLFSIWQKEITLLEEETKFPGKEVAYIHTIKEKFNS